MSSRIQYSRPVKCKHQYSNLNPFNIYDTDTILKIYLSSFVVHSEKPGYILNLFLLKREKINQRIGTTYEEIMEEAFSSPYVLQMAE